ncbi:RlpA-like double-psi beta-barrel-protein domain-containing protein-containing protein [Xylariaceae sp. FL0016]|nr:RlpA-like double-psi beta-barrel-protein domain-containing protein-containing protein [Xylariaceae sp. FL0016]
MLSSPAKIILALGLTLGQAAAKGKHAAFSGDMTFYTPGLGSCGVTNSASDHVVALSTSQISGNCGKSINIHYNGKTASAKVEDTCAGCKSGDVDVSPAVFDSLADPDQGRVQVTWEFA